MKKLSLLLIVITIFSSCSRKIPFTSDIQSKHKFSEKTLKQVQFYTSDEIVLFQSTTDGDAGVNDGKILLTDSKASEKIIIKKNTPCVLEKIINENLFVFSFEYGNDKFLAFGNDVGGYYSLMANDWNNKKGELSYANRSYTTYSGNVFLKVKIKKLSKQQNRERTIKGRKIK